MNQRLIQSRGFTLVEAMMSMLLVSVLAVSAIRVTGASGLAQYKAAERATGRLLGDGLMNDIMLLPYEDPTVAGTVGVESGETSSSKATFDDIDDYNGWTESPPQQRDGTIIANTTGWSRSVTMDRVTAANPTVVSGSETGAKRVTITVKHNNVPVVTRVAIRTSAP